MILRDLKGNVYDVPDKIAARWKIPDEVVAGIMANFKDVGKKMNEYLNSLTKDNKPTNKPFV